jgi:Domain of unknown function (DUF4395)
MSTIFGFPRTVNEVSARLVAGGVVTQAALWIVTRHPLLLVSLTYGFLARVLTGPRLSPLGQFVTRVVTPRLRVAERIVPGAPKRFAQGIGLACTAAASAAWFLGVPTVSVLIIGVLIVAASLEAFVGFCLGCKIFALLMKIGLIPEDTCEECNNLELRWARQAAAAGLSS